MGLDLALLRNKKIGPSPKGPLGAGKSRAAGFAAGRNFGLSKNKKKAAGAAAGIGQAGRAKKKHYPTNLGAYRTGGPLQVPRGPGVMPGTGKQSVRLPNRQKSFAAPPAPPAKPGILGRFFSRLKRG